MAGFEWHNKALKAAGLLPGGLWSDEDKLAKMLTLREFKKQVQRNPAIVHVLGQDVRLTS